MKFGNEMRLRPYFVYKSIWNNFGSIFACAVLLLVFFQEVVVYCLSSYGWYQIGCENQSECTRILLVADPQLIGLRNEKIRWITPISIWDSDRYLIKTFVYAFGFAKPDVVVFLGDLLDEGSTSTDDEYKTYIRRFFRIFLRAPFDSIRHIFIPGDNDIGGETLFDTITDHKLKRYQHAFSQPDTIPLRNITFYKINRLTQTMPKISETMSLYDTNIIRVGLSHIPLMFTPGIFVDKVLGKMQPHVLFTAHEHKSMIVQSEAIARNDRLITPVTANSNRIFEYYLGVADIYEFIVPTCSYRMGTNKIGYGFAVIENGTIRYTVLWSPSRFAQLALYAFLVIAIVFWMLVRMCCKRKRTLRSYHT